jgi:lysophospholipase L1-like esterase
MSNMKPHAKPTLSIFNQGRCGQNSTVARGVYESDLLGRGVKPDFVLIYLGMNDVINHRFFTYLEDFLANMEWMINLATKQGITPVVCSIHHVIEEELYKHHSWEYFLPETVNSKVDRYNAGLKQMLKRQAVALADYQDATGRLDPSAFLSRDGVHLSATGNKLLAKTFFDAIPGDVRSNAAIVCVGDSLTYGYENSGAGTTEGETYPAFLKMMIQGG